MKTLRFAVALLMALGIVACSAPNPYGHSSGYSSGYSSQAAPAATPTPSSSSY